MNNYFQRKLITKIAIWKEKYLKPIVFLKLMLIIIIIFLLLPGSIYLIVYSGYSRRIIYTTDQIPEELTEEVIISQDEDNFKYLAQSSVDAFSERKINSFYLFLINKSKELKDEDILRQLSPIPQGLIQIDRSKESLFEICEGTKNIYKLSKFVILSFKDTTIRSTFICNNQDLYTQGIVPKVDEQTLEVSHSTFKDYLKDMTKVFLGIDLSI